MQTRWITVSVGGDGIMNNARNIDVIAIESCILYVLSKTWEMLVESP
jgi:hypothetical protein